MKECLALNLELELLRCLQLTPSISAPQACITDLNWPRELYYHAARQTELSHKVKFPRRRRLAGIGLPMPRTTV